MLTACPRCKELNFGRRLYCKLCGHETSEWPLECSAFEERPLHLIPEQLGRITEERVDELELSRHPRNAARNF
jgi:hypothetical protein